MKRHHDLTNFFMQKMFTYITKHAKFWWFFMANRGVFCFFSPNTQIFITSRFWAFLQVENLKIEI